MKGVDHVGELTFPDMAGCASVYLDPLMSLKAFSPIKLLRVFSF